MIEKQLFTGTFDLVYFAVKEKSLRERLAHLGKTEVESPRVNATKKKLNDQFKITPLRLSRTQPKLETRMLHGKPIEYVRYAVAIEGSQELLDIGTKGLKSTMPTVNYHPQGKYLEFLYPRGERPAEEIKAEFERTLTAIEEAKEWQFDAVEKYNQKVENLIDEAISEKQQKAASDDDFLSKL